MNSPRVAIVGIVPPPFGGVSVHVQRLIEHLSNYGINYVFYDSWKDNWFLKCLFNRRIKLIHIHTSLGIDTKMLLKTFFLSFINKKTVLTYHSFRSNRNPNFRHKLLFMRITKIIVVSKEIGDKLFDFGVNRKKIKIISPFIRPIFKQEEFIKIPASIWEFIDTHNPIITANAWKISFFNNQDLYGIDMCVDLCINLKKSYHNIGFVFCLPLVNDYEYLQKMNQKIAENGIKDNFLFVTEQYPYYPILMKTHIFVRPTNTDGYGISVAEAIYFKVPAIASDVCVRPKGTILFRCRDMNDLIVKAKNILDNYEYYKKRLDQVEFENTVEKIIDIYKKVEIRTLRI